MTGTEQSNTIEDQHLTETLHFAAYAVRNVVLTDSYPLDPAQYHDLTAGQPILSAIAMAFTGAAISWFATLFGKYLSPTPPERWEESALMVLVVLAAVAHSLAGTFGNKRRRTLLKEIKKHFETHPREVLSIGNVRQEKARA